MQEGAIQRTRCGASGKPRRRIASSSHLSAVRFRECGGAIWCTKFHAACTTHSSVGLQLQAMRTMRGDVVERGHSGVLSLGNQLLENQRWTLRRFLA